MLGGTVRGTRATLRTTTESDLGDHLRWHADPELTQWMAQRPTPVSLEQRKEWLKETAKDHGLVHWELEAAGAHVGYCAVRLMFPPMADAWSLQTLFVAPEARQKGFGGDAVRALHRYLVDYLGLVSGDVWLYRDDAVGRRLFEGLGYLEYAHGHDVFYREGRYWDDWRGLLRAETFRARFPHELEYPEGPSHPTRARA